MRRSANSVTAIAGGLLLAAGFATTKAQTPAPPRCQAITVIGAVKSPGRFKVEGRLRLFEALAQAGGPSSNVGKIVQVIHTCPCSPCDEIAGSRDTVEYDSPALLRARDGAEPYVVPGDIVIVPEDLVFVIDVSGKKTIIYREGMRLSQAIAAASVIAKSIDHKRVRIHRPGAAGAPIMVLNLKAVIQGQIEDPLLRVSDILEISDEQGRFVNDDSRRHIFMDPPLFPRKSPNC